MGFFKEKNVVRPIKSVEELESEVKRLQQLIDDERRKSEREIDNLRFVNNRSLTEAKLDYELAVRDLKAAHKLELDQRDFDLKNQKDDLVMKANAERDKAVSDMLVLKKELEVTLKIVDINSDIVDVKDIINKLITALPKINLEQITLNSTK